MTSLMIAAIMCHIDIVTILINHYAAVHCTDNLGSTPLILCVRFTKANKARDACVRYLLENGANPKLRDNEGRSALDWAELNGHEQCVSLLRQNLSALSDGS